MKTFVWSLVCEDEKRVVPMKSLLQQLIILTIHGDPDPFIHGALSFDYPWWSRFWYQEIVAQETHV